MNQSAPPSVEAAHHLGALSSEGYTVISGGMQAGTAASLLEALQTLHAGHEPAMEAEQPFLNRGHHLLYNLQREEPRMLQSFSRHTLVMAILRGLLNDAYYKQIPADRPNFILRSLIGRSSGPAAMPLHIDSFVPSGGQFCIACQVSMILEDQTTSTGCTLVVPGSHRADEYADQEALRRAVPVETRAGDIVIWDARLWHGALGNQTGRSRWALIATFTRWWIKQNYDITGALPQRVYEALDDDEKVILGYCSRPPRDEGERIDIKSGHAALRPRVSDYSG